LIFDIIFLLHTDSFGRAGVNANAAIDTGVDVNHRLVINHFDCLARAFFHAGFTAVAFFLIYDSRHLRSPFKKTAQNLPAKDEMLQNYDDITI